MSNTETILTRNATRFAEWRDQGRAVPDLSQHVDSPDLAGKRGCVYPGGYYAELVGPCRFHATSAWSKWGFTGSLEEVERELYAEYIEEHVDGDAAREAEVDAARETRTREEFVRWACGIPVTFSEWRVRGRDVEDLEAEFVGCGVSGPGRVYPEGVYAQRLADGQWYVILEREEVTGYLGEVEAALFQWLFSEGLL